MTTKSDIRSPEVDDLLHVLAEMDDEDDVFALLDRKSVV